MLHDDSLANRLNGERGDNIEAPMVQPHPVQQMPTPPQKTFNPEYAKWQFFYDVYKTLVNQLSILIAALLYGVAFSTLFTLGWSLLQCLGVGLVLNHAIVFLLNLTKKIKLPKGPVIKE